MQLVGQINEAIEQSAATGIDAAVAGGEADSRIVPHKIDDPWP